jgi:hypothetical protein
MDYKNKYLKYKNKYLSLRDKYLNIFSEEYKTKGYNKNKYLSLKKSLKGGANCPKVGFFQHIGECWHDAFSMVLLYSDGLSEHIQNVFDNNFNVDECIEYAKQNSDRCLLPKNIKAKDYDKFIYHARQYISELYSRYMNDKKDFLEDLVLASNPPIDFSRARRNSITETLVCTKSIMDIRNINIKPEFKRDYTFEYHGATRFFYEFSYEIIAIELFNYLLLNYFPLTPYNLPIKKKFIHNETIYIKADIINILDLETLNEINMDELIRLYQEILKLESLIDVCNGVIIHLYDNENYASAHAAAFIKCKDKEFFYDNNSVIPGENVKEYIHDESELFNKSDKYRINKKTVLKEFKWKTYLKEYVKWKKEYIEDIFKEIILFIKMYRKSKKKFNYEYIFKRPRIKSKIYKLYKVFQDHTLPGKAYLEYEMSIYAFNCIVIKDFIDEQSYKDSIPIFIKTMWERGWDVDLGVDLGVESVGLYSG